MQPEGLGIHGSNCQGATYIRNPFPSHKMSKLGGSQSTRYCASRRFSLWRRKSLQICHGLPISLKHLQRSTCLHLSFTGTSAQESICARDMASRIDGTPTSIDSAKGSSLLHARVGLGMYLQLEQASASCQNIQNRVTVDCKAHC